MQGDEQIIPRPIVGGLGPSAAPRGRPYGVDYRQLQEPEQGNPTWALSRDAAGIGSEAKALGEVFRQFGAASADIYNKTERQLGAQAGAAAGAAGNGAPKSALASLTSYGQGYDAAVHATYSMHAQQSLEDSITGLEQQHVGDPIAFGTAATQVAQSAIKEMPPIYQPEMQLFANARIQAGVNRQRGQAIADARNTALSEYQQSTPTLISSALHTAAALPGPQGDAVIAKLESDDRDRLNALVAAHVITPEQANTLHEKMVADATHQMAGQRVDNSLQPILQTMRSNLEAADKLIVQPDPNLTPAENAVRLHEFEKDRQEYIEAQTHAHVKDLAAVHQQLAQGDFGQGVESTLHGLYQAGALSQEGLYSGLAESLRNQKKRIGDEADAQLVDAIMHGEHPGPLDPDNKVEAKAVDQYFQEHIAQSGAIGGNQYAAGAAEVVRQTGIVPASVESHIRVGLLSGDPVQTANAAALAARIESVNPRADVFAKSRRLAAFSGLINSNLQSGMSPVQAYNLATRITNLPPEQRKIRDDSYKVALKAQGPNGAALQKQIDSEAGGFFSHAPAAPLAMQADYDGLVREYYDQTGNLGQSRQLAAAQLHKTWGVSTVNGSPELMKYPIPGAMVPAVRADIAQDAKAAGYTGDPGQIHLVPNSFTDASGGKVWGLVHTDPATGVADVLLDKQNRPLVYRLPSGPDFAKARQTLIEQKLAHARQLRAAQRENSADQIMFEKQLADEILHGNAAQRQMAGR